MRAAAVVFAVAGLMAPLGAPPARARCISVEVGGTTVPCADPNQAAVARALDNGTGSTAFNNLVLDVAALPAEEIPFALTQLGNQIATVFPGILQGDRRAVIASFIDRLGPSCLQKQRPDDPASYDPTVWARGLYRKSDIWTAGGVTTGLEAHPDRHSCAGFGFNYMGTDAEFSGLPQGANLNAYNLGFYGRRDWRLLFVDGAAAGTYGTIDSARGIDFAHETAHGNSVGLGAGLAVGVGVVLRFGAITMEPRIGLDYDHDAQGGFTERGAGAANLHLSSFEHDLFRSSLGTRVAGILPFPSGAFIMPEFSVAWDYSLINETVEVRERFVAAQNASFTISGEEQGRNYLAIGGGVSIHPNDTNEVFVRYDSFSNPQQQDQSYTLGAKFRW